MPFIGSCKWHNTLFWSRDRVTRMPERAYRVLILIRPQRGILTRILFGISGGGGDTLSTIKYTIPKMQAEHRAVKRSPVKRHTNRWKNQNRCKLDEKRPKQNHRDIFSSNWKSIKISDLNKAQMALFHLLNKYFSPRVLAKCQTWRENWNSPSKIIEIFYLLLAAIII